MSNLRFALPLLALSAFACTKVPEAAPAKAALVDDAPHKEAREIYTSRCSPCHGNEGAGDGAAAAALVPKPRNFHDRAWQGGITDAVIEKTIAEGGPAVGKSPIMPPNPDLVGKPAVLAALREQIRAWGP